MLSVYGGTQESIQGVDDVSLQSKKQNITLTALLEDQGDPTRWESLIEPAMEKLVERHPEVDIGINYTTFPYNETRAKILSALEAKAPVDLITVDQIWLGEFAGKGLLSELSNFTETWGRQPDWYQANWDGGIYQGKLYGIWAWTDVRGIWYWKDMLEEAGVDPNSLKTWDGYIAAAKKLNSTLNGRGIEGMHLTGASHSPDLWYPYLWMLGGDIVERRAGHPTKDIYWFPAYNSSEGVQALQFLEDQVGAGIAPQKNHSWGEEFVNREFAVMIEASHVPLYFQPEQPQNIKEKVGFMPLPVPSAEGTYPTTMMGGWELSVPITSKNKALAWELITLIAEPNILAPWLAKYGYLPTQLAIGQGEFSNVMRQYNPYYEEMISMIPTGLSRPSIQEYPEIADNIREAIDEVYYGKKQPNEALQDAAMKSAKVLGW